jgi:WD40 repeat protein
MQCDRENIILFSLPALEQYPAIFPRTTIQAVAFASAGTRIVGLASRDPRLFVFDAASGQLQGSPRLQDSFGHALGRGLGGDGGIELTYDGTLRRFGLQGIELEGPDSGLTDPSVLALSPDGRVAVGLFKHVLRAWDAEQFTPLARAIITELRDCTLSVSNLGYAVLAGLHGKRARVLRWDPRGGELSEIPLGVAVQWTPRVAAAAQASAFAWTNGSLVEVCDPIKGMTIRLDEWATMIIQLALSPDGRVLAAGAADGSIELRWLSGNERRLLSPGHTSAVTALAFSTDGKRLASGSSDTSVLVWSVVP